MLDLVAKRWCYVVLCAFDVLLMRRGTKYSRGGRSGRRVTLDVTGLGHLVGGLGELARIQAWDSPHTDPHFVCFSASILVV